MLKKWLSLIFLKRFYKVTANMVVTRSRQGSFFCLFLFLHDKIVTSPSLKPIILIIVIITNHPPIKNEINLFACYNSESHNYIVSGLINCLTSSGSMQ